MCSKVLSWVKNSALSWVADIGVALQKIQLSKSEPEVILAYQNNLNHEAMECIKSNKWDLARVLVKLS